MTQSATPLLDERFAELLRIAGEKGDLPGFSQSARSIVDALNADADNDFELVQTVLTDAGLTQRVLRLANSAMYNVFGGEVGTVTRAIQVLGVQTVAHLALGLKIIESADRSRPSSAATLAEMQKSVMAGFMGRHLAGGKASPKDTEAAAVCAVLMGLGRMLVCFYLPEAWSGIERRIAANEAPDDAARAVLGGSFSDVGQRMAQHWGLPPTLTDCLQACTPQAGQGAETHEQWLRMIATASTECARLVHASPDDHDAGIGAVADVFASSLGLEADAMKAAVGAARTAAQDHFAQGPVALVRPMTESDRHARMLRGIDELKTAARSSSLSEMLGLALEYLHGNFAARRSFCFLLFVKDKRYRARYGLGAGATALLPALQFDSVPQPDLFHAVLPREQVLFLENAKADNVRAKLPEWWRAALGDAQSLCILPLHMNGTPVGFLYVDWVNPMMAPRMDAARLGALTQVRETLVAHVAKPPR